MSLLYLGFTLSSLPPGNSVQAVAVGADGIWHDAAAVFTMFPLPFNPKRIHGVLIAVRGVATRA